MCLTSNTAGGRRIFCLYCRKGMTTVMESSRQIAFWNRLKNLNCTENSGRAVECWEYKKRIGQTQPKSQEFCRGIHSSIHAYAQWSIIKNCRQSWLPDLECRITRKITRINVMMSRVNDTELLIILNEMSHVPFKSTVKGTDLLLRS